MCQSMNSESDYIEKVRRVAILNMSTTSEPFQIITKALQVFPHSAALWCLRGELIQLSDGSTLSSDDARASFEKAIELDPSFSSAYEEIGYYCDVVSKDFLRAEEAFRKAIALGAGGRSYEGLGRVLAQLGRMREALTLIRGCPHYDAKGTLRELEKEIEDGMWSPS